MSNLFRIPIRVYILFGLLAFFGLLAGKSLSISLFPTSSRPTIAVRLDYHNLTADDFMRTYGRDLESRLQAISFDGHDVEKVEADYGRTTVRYQIHYHWGTPSRGAEKETAAVAQNFASIFPQEIRDSLGIYTPENSVGFFALMYYSDKRSLEELYAYLEPILTPRLGQIPDAQFVELWNPASKEIQISLNPERMAELGLLPRTLIDTLSNTFHSDSGGYVQIGSEKLEVVMRRQVDKGTDLENVLIPTTAGNFILLKELATISVSEPKDRQRIIRTSGQKSLMVYAQPRPGGNIKKMSEDILKVIQDVQPTLPADIQARPLVDPSVFIRSAVENVIYEVVLAACLAVLILFAFIGNLKNVATAAIEIPISIVLSFILMKWAGINLNLISLAGLALSAGMNVDGSVVVMENIFRHFEKRKHEILTWADRLEIVTDSVKEVRLPLIATTIASLVVFLPLGFTSALTNALLGDLAWAVVFSHGISAFVALILVPTIRLHLLRKGMPLEKPAPLEHVLHWLENRYTRSLQYFLTTRRLQIAVLLGAAVAFIAALVFILPKLPREIIGKPDTDWVSIDISAPNLTNIHQMDGLVAETEARITDTFSGRMLYTFSQSYAPRYGEIMFRLKDKRQMEAIIAESEKIFISSPDVRYSVGSFNPSELPIPNPPNLRVEIRGQDATQIQIAGESIWDLLMESDRYANIGGAFSPGRHDSVLLEPNWSQISLLGTKATGVRAWDIADISRLATSGAKVGDIRSRNSFVPVWLRYPDERVRTLSDLESLPIGIQGRILPLKALATPVMRISEPNIFHENGRQLGLITGFVKADDKLKADGIYSEVAEKLRQWQKTHEAGGNASSTVGGTTSGATSGVTIQFSDGQEELSDALRQLSWAVALSILLIFVTMVIQFGDVASAALILVPIPLGFIGVLLSLWIFHSTLSLNSALGTILLNGIVVGNSIILVDFYRREIQRGLGPLEAALSSSKIRMRPILMTSLTTGLGMLPIAFGFGEGGKILQPLGLAVVGGLTLSFLMTLFIVPLLQCWYWTWKLPRVADKVARGPLTSESKKIRPDSVINLLVLALICGFTPLTSQAAATPTALGGPNDTFRQWVRARVREYPLVKQKLEVLDGSHARRLSSKLRLLPQISGTAQRYMVDNPRSESQNYSIVADLNLFRFGADNAEIAKQNALNDYNLARIDQAKQSAEIDVTELYFLDLDTRLRRKVLSEMNDQDATIRKIGIERFNRGLLPSEEREKLELDITNRHAEYEKLEQEARETESRRATLSINEQLAAWPWLDAASEKFLHSIAEKGLDLAQHPDWRADDSSWMKTQADRDQAWASLYPSLDARAYYASGETLGSPVLSGNQPSWTNSIILTVPIFTGYQTYAGYKEAIANKTIAEITRENTRRRIMEEWKARVAQFAQWSESLQLRKHGVDAAFKISESSLRRFRAGHESVNDLALDQERARRSELLLLDSQIEYHRAALRMVQAAGEVWSDN